MIRAAERWLNIKVTEFERSQMQFVRQELDQLHEAQNGLAKAVSEDARPRKLSSGSRT